ncbi:MAG: hypothetical protein ABI665_27080 [Vicinamibacterales bacterium]
MLLNIVNGSATEIRSVALPGHTFRVVALDGNPLAAPVEVPVLWPGLDGAPGVQVGLHAVRPARLDAAEGRRDDRDDLHEDNAARNGCTAADPPLVDVRAT